MDPGRLLAGDWQALDWPTRLHSVVVAEESAAGQIVDGDLVIVGGRVVVQPGARITGAVYVASGDLDVDGRWTRT
jgi:hypothetical protein